MPQGVFFSSPPSRAPMSKLPESAPGVPMSPGVTSTTSARQTKPLPSGSSTPVSASLTPWPSAPKAPLSGSI